MITSTSRNYSTTISSHHYPEPNNCTHFAEIELTLLFDRRAMIMQLLDLGSQFCYFSLIHLRSGRGDACGSTLDKETLSLYSGDGSDHGLTDWCTSRCAA